MRRGAVCAVRNTTGFFDEQEWRFAPHEISALPGSPATPDHPLRRRVLYGAIGTLIGLTGGLGIALVSINLPYLQGSLGLYQDEIAWLPAVYVMTNVPTGIILIKYRQQFGLRSFTLTFQAIYCILAIAHFFVIGFPAAIAVRAASGIAGSALTTLALNYFIQAFPASTRLKAISIGVAVPQLAYPLARLLSPGLLAYDQWRTLSLFEIGLALVCFGAIAIVRLPPSVREKSFEWLDLPTLSLFTVAIALVSAVLAIGRFAWWTETVWLGWALAGSLPLFGAVFLIEFNRANPIIDFRWLGTVAFLRFVMIGTIARIVLSEQTYGTVGLMSVLGYTSDQLLVFSALTVAGGAAGIVVGAIIVGPNRLGEPVALALGIVAFAAYFDSQASNLTRPPELYLTQMLIAFATTLYIGPAILIGLTQVLAKGGKALTSFIGLFATTQSLGGLIGTALLSTYQIDGEKQHSFDVTQHLNPSDPQVTLALQQGAARYATVLQDPTLRTAEGAASLAQRVTLEANVLAFNDVFRLISIIAAVTSGFLLMLIVHRRWAARRSASNPAAT